jgi:hypothetical protein
MTSPQKIPEPPCTEIILQPDGRIFVHGLSRQVLDILVDLQPCDPQLQSLLRSAQPAKAAVCE